jgi:hypothetical protein
VYKNPLGPRIRQDEEQEIVYNHNASNFFATDLKVSTQKGYLWPYMGVLVDYTSPEKRDNLFYAPIKKDYLGTAGITWALEDKRFSWKIEAARNFGEGESADERYKDVVHCGYLFFTDVDCHMGSLTPTFQFLLTSGNKATLDMARDQDTTLTSGRNRAFSSFSPLNRNLGDSIGHNNSSMRPLVATASGYGIQYGVPRPRTFGSADLDNLIMPSLGFDWQATKKLSIGIFGYYMSSFERGVGMLDGEPKYLSRDLGWEADWFFDYQLNKHTLVSFFGGYFIPGKYYREKRDDTGGSLLSPYLRGDGHVDAALDVEFSIEFVF